MTKNKKNSVKQNIAKLQPSDPAHGDLERLRIKVCGMRNKENILQLVQLPIDYIGFIFYPGSPRYAGEKIDQSIISQIPEKIQKVGLFVNAPVEDVIKIANENQIDLLQLHGNETPDYCSELSGKGFPVIKALSVDELLSEKLIDYRFCCNYYLFDTPTSKYGGSGKKFDWKILENQKMYLPFFLSGGISPDDADIIRNLYLQGFHALDINSKFEIEPGIKDIGLIKHFIKELK
jgi:phosphoribosylanthranilate isomerase